MKPLFTYALLQFFIIVLLFCIMKPGNAQEIPIGQTFSADTIFQPFQSNQAVYSIRINGSIQLYSNSSLVRVVLVDSYGNHFLIYESYPLITDTNTFTINSGCDETCFMDGIIPDSLRVDIISAFCTIDNLKFEPEYISNVKELQEQAKWTSDSVKIATMNRRIQEEHMYWRAGRTDLTTYSFSQKEKKFGKKFRLSGYDFYMGGIYESPYIQVQSPSISVYTAQFSWQDRHDANDSSSFYFDGDDNASIDQRSGWLTPPKPQSPCQSCYAFSAIALVEAYANLYFNNGTFNPDPEIQHHIDLDLSELKSMRCNQHPSICDSGGYPSNILSYVRDHYMSEEDCFPYSYAQNDPPCGDTCLNPVEFVRISGYDYLKWRNDEYLKKMLIMYGPLSCFVNDYYNMPPGLNDNHVVLLVGYEVVKVGDTVYHGTGLNDSAIVIDPNCHFIDGTSWIFKDSGLNSFIKRGLDTNNLNKYQSHFLRDGIFRFREGTQTNIQCSDEDGDGYYWWGIHRDAQGNQIDPFLCNCPPGVNASEEDCNDNDPNSGPFDLTSFECTNIADSCQTSDEALDIDENYQGSRVWFNDMHIRRNIIIAGGNTLEIKCNVFFSPGAKIIVQPGGTLKLGGSIANPARLTSGCGEFWGGVELQGDAGSSQDTMNQGRIIVKYGIIENAKCGIKTINAGTVPDGGGFLVEEGTPSGGIIQATGAIFRNNITGAKFLPYRYSGSNNSYFKGCTFETTDRLFEQEQPKHHLEITGITGLKIQGCTFRNLVAASIMPMSNRGKGIYLYNSEVIIDTLKKLGTITVNLPCSFDSLNYGIYALTSSLGSSCLDVHLTRFKDNGRGIYASGFTHNNSLEIDSSEFEYLHGLAEDSVYMLYLNNCTGFKIHQNSFTGTTNVNHDQYGVIVNNSGTDNNYIYDNTFQRLTYGLQGLNINHNTDAAIDKGVPVFIPTGLRFICNRFTDVGCNTDFLINEIMEDPPFQPGIAYNQRNAANITYPTQEPASNIFTQSHGDTNDVRYDIDISTSVGKILYTYHKFPENLHLKPDYVSNKDWVGYKEYSYFEYVDSVSCRDDFFPEEGRTELRSALSQANYKVDSLITLLRLLVDDGSTDTLKSTVDNSLPPQSYDVYQDLLSASPYLSDSVVKTSIQKEDVLPNAMIRDIMVANPQSVKSEDLLNTLDQRAEPMPDSMWVEILQGKDTVGTMDRLVDELSGWIQRRDLYFHGLAEFFKNVTANSWASDSLVSLCLSDTWLSSRYLLVNYYLGIFDYSSANNVLHNIPYDFDLTEQQSETYAKMIDLVSILPQLYNDTSGYIVPDSSQSVILEDLATLDYDIPGAWARNILIASGLMAYDEPVFSGSTLKSSRKDKYHWTRSHSIESVFKVFPNPASDFIIVESKNNCDNNEGLVRILDLDGRIFKSQLLRKKENQQIIPVNDLASGTYIVQFVSNGSCKGSQKVVIIR